MRKREPRHYAEEMFGGLPPEEFLRPDPMPTIKGILGMPAVTDHKAEAESAARAGKYDIAQYHATMRLCDLLEEDQA